MSEIMKLRIDRGYSTVFETDDQTIVARCMEVVGKSLAARSPDQHAIAELKGEMETLRNDMNLMKYHRTEAEKKLKAAEEKIAAMQEAAKGLTETDKPE